MQTRLSSTAEHTAVVKIGAICVGRYRGVVSSNLTGGSGDVLGVRNYLKTRKIGKLEKEKNALVAVRELEKLQREMREKGNSINFDEHLRDLNELERQVVLEERIKKLKAKGLK